MSAIDLQVFHDNGLQRRICEITSLPFWTSDQERTTCGDTHADEYTFIGKPLIEGFPQRGKDLKDAMRDSFIGFFEQKAHSPVESYPILARWRDDIHLTIASIADFQPHVTNGIAEPPANPLAISQRCIRLTDVDAVGHSGRHLTTFEMMAHHVFNRPDDGIMHYWMEECVSLCHEMLTSTFGIDSSQIIYVENPWSGGGNAGAAVEVIVGGLELATLVFMDLVEDESGDVEIKGVKYTKMPLQIIDTGYGLERFCWAAAGTPTIYDAIYPESVAWLNDLAGIDFATEFPEVEVERLLSEISRLSGIMNIEIGSDELEMRTKLIERLEERGLSVSEEIFSSITSRMSRVYAIPDHMHALCNMLGDGLVPSNAKAGYLARMMARRVLRMRDELGITVSLAELGAHHLDTNLSDWNMKQTREGLLHMLDLEETRYNEMLRKGEQVVNTQLKGVAKDAEELPDELLFNLNDSHGITPEIAINLARKSGWKNVSLRTGFTAELTERHALAAKLAAKSAAVDTTVDLSSLPPTELNYYDDSFLNQVEATVLACFDYEDHHGVVLDKTCFYPEGGGQEGDRGQIDGVEVIDTRKQGEHVIHVTLNSIEVGRQVKCVLDWPRRKQLMDHHTAVHIVGGAARILLGPHIYQAGANKSVESGRLDITHHTRLTRDDLDAIEQLANSVLSNVETTEKSELNRKDADLTFGFDLYQGGAPKGSNVRILRIGDHDTQACGGTHHDEPSRIGQIRVIKSTAVQDGVERLHIVAGDAAIKHARSRDELLRRTSQTFSVTSEEVPAAAERFYNEWKDQRKRIEQLEAEIVRLRTSGGGDDLAEVDGVRVVIMEVDGDLKQMTKMLKELTLDSTKPTLAILGSREGGGKLMVATTENTIASERYNAVEILRAISSHINGGGGGRPTFAQGGGSNPDGLPQSLESARTLIGA